MGFKPLFKHVSITWSQAGIVKYIHVTVYILFPTLDLSAVGQDELLKRVYAQFTIQSPCFLHLDGFVAMLLVGIYPKKYLKKNQMWCPLFLCIRGFAVSLIMIRGVRVHGVGEGQLGIFPVQTLYVWIRTKKDISFPVCWFLHRKLEWMPKGCVQTPYLYLLPPRVDTDGKPVTITPPGVHTGTAARSFILR